MNTKAKSVLSGKKIIIAVIALLAIILCIAACSGLSSSGNAEIYDDAVQKLCSGDYDGAYNELSGISDYENAEEIAKYALLVKNFDEKDYKNYESTLKQLSSIKDFNNTDLNDNRQKFEEKVSRLIKQRDEDYKTAEALEKEIDSLNVVGLDDKAKIASLQNQYDKSSYIVKEQVKNISKLQQASEKIISIEENQEKAKAAEEKINAIGTVSLSSKAAIESARNSYNSLPSDAKPYVNNISVLSKAEDDYDELLKKEQAEKTRAAVTTKKAQKQSSGESSGSHQNHAATVYWVKNGKVYHVSRNCPTLSRSKSISSGTVSQSGKSRACKVCS